MTTLTAEQKESIRLSGEVVLGELEAQFKAGMHHGFRVMAEFFDSQSGLNFTAEQVALMIRYGRDSMTTFHEVTKPITKENP